MAISSKLTSGPGQLPVSPSPQKRPYACVKSIPFAIGDNESLRPD